MQMYYITYDIYDMFVCVKNTRDIVVVDPKHV